MRAPPDRLADHGKAGAPMSKNGGAAPQEPETARRMDRPCLDPDLPASIAPLLMAAGRHVRGELRQVWPKDKFRRVCDQPCSIDARTERTGLAVHVTLGGRTAVPELQQLASGFLLGVMGFQPAGDQSAAQSRVAEVVAAHDSDLQAGAAEDAAASRPEMALPAPVAPQQRRATPDREKGPKVLEQHPASPQATQKLAVLRKSTQYIQTAAALPETANAASAVLIASQSRAQQTTSDEHGRTWTLIGSRMRKVWATPAAGIVLKVALNPTALAESKTESRWSVRQTEMIVFPTVRCAVKNAPQGQMVVAQERVSPLPEAIPDMQGPAE